MNFGQPNRVSVIDPITPAIDRVKLMLFKPFDLGKWFVIGFCAWLSGYRPLGGGGGGHGGGGGGGGSGPPYNVPQEEIKHAIEEARYFVSENLYWIAPAVVTLIVLIVLIGFLVTWLSSRGRFMFLHCVATNKAEVRIPWHKFRRQGNSLFLFRIVLGIIGFFVVIAPIIGIVVLVIKMISGTLSGVVAIPTMLILLITIIALSVFLFLVKKLTFDFVVPIMSLRMVSCKAGWREFMTLLSANKLRFALYLLFQIVILIVIGVIKTIGFCIGCCFCCASCLLLIPYVGTVIYLPFFVFKRGYSLYYLQQYGPQFDVFRSEVETVESI